MHVALMDDADYPLVKDFSWHKTTKGYAATTLYLGGYKKGKPKYRTILMHRWILGLPKALPWVDHRNRNKMDNQRHNLRHADGTINNINRPIQRNNTSGFHGVFLHKRNYRGRVYAYWVAEIVVRGERIVLGQSKIKEEAVLLRERGEIKYGFTNS